VDVNAFFLFFQTDILKILITYVCILIFSVNCFNLGCTCECIYGVVLRFLKIHCQYGSNFHWESYIDLIVIFNYIREIFFPYLTRYKVFALGCIIMFDVDQIFFALSKKRKIIFPHVLD